MNSKAERVFNGWLALSPSERSDFERAVRDYNTGTATKQQEIRESTREHLTKMQTGPLGQTCACCGR